MPFDSFSPKSEDDYLSAGFTEVIIANLAKVQDLMVISRTSVMRYQGSEKSLKEIGCMFIKQILQNMLNFLMD